MMCPASYFLCYADRFTCLGRLLCALLYFWTCACVRVSVAPPSCPPQFHIRLSHLHAVILLAMLQPVHAYSANRCNVLHAKSLGACTRLAVV
jgi:hypothetical protein